MAKHNGQGQPAPATGTDTIPYDDAVSEGKEIVAKLDDAWVKIQNALQQEAEGRKLWIEGTLELINILEDARKRLASDQAFGTWLTDNGYGEERINRHDRSALLNMALAPNVTREVLEQTYRRSWQLIWREEIQPRLPSPRQPADAEGPEDTDGEAPDGQPEASNDEGPEEAPTATTRRSKKKKPPKEPWAGDLKRFLGDALRTANDAMALKRTIEQCAPDQLRKLQEEVDPFLLEKLKQAEEALAYVHARLDGSLEEEVDGLIKKGRIRTTPARRASASVQPSA